MIPWILALFCVQVQGASAPLAAEKDATAQQQQPASVPPQQDAKTQDRLDDQEDRIKDLERRLAETEKRQSQMTSANPFTVLNPRMTVSGDFLWRTDDKRVYLNNDPTIPGNRIDDTINMREVEMDLRASVDPYVEAVGVISVGSDIPGQFDIEVEEFYAIIKSLPLPLWETPPLGTKIKVGRFRTAFGMNNISHTHDLPQSDRPLVIEEFLGPDGMNANGISTTSFLPSPGDTALELTLQVLQGQDNIPIAQDHNELCYLGNLNWFVPLADEHSVNVAAIGFYGVNSHDEHHQDVVTSLDVFYKWKPLRQGEYNSFLLEGQMFYARHEFDDPVTGLGTRTHPFGYTVWGQYQLTANLYGGVRWDSTDILTNDHEHRKKVSPYFTWYTSEFFRTRFTYEHTWSDNPAEAGLDSFFVELVIVFGAHPPEPFWVNK
jgi:hypothetical protein